MRKLGIPTVLDRFIQQALLQVLQPMFDPSFSQHSYGFRPGRRAHDAVRRGAAVRPGRPQRRGGRGPGEVLRPGQPRRADGQTRQAHRDRRVLGLIRRYLEAGILANGVVMERYEGTPQGGPLSPLLANVLLDEVDKELEKRGHAFVRYADDCNVYVRSRRAGERVMGLLRRLYAELRLRVNEVEKRGGPGAATPQAPGLLVLGSPGTCGQTPGQRQGPCGDEGPGAWDHRAHGWTQHRASGHEELRGYLAGWKEYLPPRGYAGDLRRTRRMDPAPPASHPPQALEARPDDLPRAAAPGDCPGDAAAKVAANGRRWWHNSAMAINIAFPIRYFDQLGLPRLAA